MEGGGDAAETATGSSSSSTDDGAAFLPDDTSSSTSGAPAAPTPEDDSAANLEASLQSCTAHRDRILQTIVDLPDDGYAPRILATLRDEPTTAIDEAREALISAQKRAVYDRSQQNVEGGAETKLVKSFGAGAFDLSAGGESRARKGGMSIAKQLEEVAKDVRKAEEHKNQEELVNQEEPGEAIVEDTLGSAERPIGFASEGGAVRKQTLPKGRRMYLHLRRLIRSPGADQGPSGHHLPQGCLEAQRARGRASAQSLATSLTMRTGRPVSTTW